MERFIQKIKFAYQRARYGIDDSMTWDLDDYLVDVIPLLLQKYLDTATVEVDSEHNTTNGRTQREWILDLISNFKTYRELKDTMFEENLENLKTKRIRLCEEREKMKNLFGELFESLWW